MSWAWCCQGSYPVHGQVLSFLPTFSVLNGKDLLLWEQISFERRPLSEGFHCPGKQTESLRSCFPLKNGGKHGTVPVLFQEKQLSYFHFCFPSHWGSTFKVKNLLPRSKFFPLRVDSILEGLLQPAKQIGSHLSCLPL